MKTYDEFVAWYNETVCDENKNLNVDLKFMYDKIYSEGYYNGYEQCEADSKEDEHWFGANSNWS